MNPLAALCRTSNSLAPLVARLAIGITMLPHGAQKTLGWFGGFGYAATMQFFTEKMQIPPALAFLAILAEAAGSVGLIVGLLSRVAAFGIAVNMVVAIVMVHAQYGLFMNWSGKQPGEGFEYHILLIGLCLVVMIAGGGAASLDRLLGRDDREF